MQKSSKARIAWLVISIVLISVMAGAIVLLSVDIVRMNDRISGFADFSESQYQNSLYEAADGLNSVENNLSKLLVTSSKTQCTVYAADICKDASAAATAASRLPVGFESTAKLQKFLNQVSDFSASYLRTVSAGGNVDAYDGQLSDLYKTARDLKNHISEITNRLDGHYRISDHLDAEGFYSVTEGEGDTESSVNYPRIIYDGPFSDAISEEKCYKAVDGEKVISEEDAVKIASEKLSVQESRFIGSSGDKSVVYIVSGKINGNEAVAGITKQGGMITSFSMSGNTGAVKYDEDYAREFALKTCKKLGYSQSLVPVWYNQIDSTGYVNLAPEVNDIIYYTDLIKVKVNLTDGGLLGLEARCYCMNFSQRQPSHVMNENAVPTLVSKNLSIKTIRLAVIPSGDGEKLCYEVSATGYGLDYFVYLDAINGEEAEIQRVVDEDQGKMVY